MLQKYMKSGPVSRIKSKAEVRPLTVSRPELLVNGSDGRFRSFVHGMLAFAARLEGVRDGFAALLGLTGVQYTILISISHLQSDGDVTVGAVADHLHLSGAFVTNETGKLLRLGLITKVQDLKDRRRVCLGVTLRGRALLSDLAPVQVQVNDVLFDFLSDEQFRALGPMIDRIVVCGDRAISLLDYLSREPLQEAKANGSAAPETKVRRRIRR
jgi:MarR family transcriptional regulator, organic hydroperoxide resistance regulator